MNIIVITGASSGLGKEFALQLNKIHYVCLCVCVCVWGRLCKLSDMYLLAVSIFIRSTNTIE